MRALRTFNLSLVAWGKLALKPEVSLGLTKMNEWNWIDLSTKNFFIKVLFWLGHHPPSTMNFSEVFFGSHSAFFLLLIFILWVTNTFINFLLNFRSKHLWNICNRKVLNWRKLCSTIFHSVLEFQVRHSNKGPTLTDDKNWISIFYTSDSKYKRAYKNWKMVFLLWPIVR